MAGAFGGGLDEHVVMTPYRVGHRPLRCSILQRGTGVPLQRFWIPVHVAITMFMLGVL
jgi:hypothetical protein